MNAGVSALTLIACIAATPCAGGNAASPFITNVENPQNTPATSPSRAHPAPPARSTAHRSCPTPTSIPRIQDPASRPPSPQVNIRTATVTMAETTRVHTRTSRRRFDDRCPGGRLPAHAASTRPPRSRPFTPPPAATPAASSPPPPRSAVAPRAGARRSSAAGRTACPHAVRTRRPPRSPPPRQGAPRRAAADAAAAAHRRVGGDLPGPLRRARRGTAVVSPRRTRP